jgi:hypothetical protein
MPAKGSLSPGKRRAREKGNGQLVHCLQEMGRMVNVRKMRRMKTVQ